MDKTYVVNVQEENAQWELIMRQAKTLIASRALPSGVENAEQAAAIVQYGRELGYPPMTSLINIVLVKGKPTLSANMLGALLKNAGHAFRPVVYTDEEVK